MEDKRTYTNIKDHGNDMSYENEIKVEPKKDLTTKQKANEIVDMLINQAHKKLTSGEDLTASEMKVCLDVCKTYGTGVTASSDVDLLSDLPFEDEDKQK
tara:strand:+ start:245 stop:541 length:297 start_codon:yes stop_codon:yes gene_type:complete